VDVGFGQLMRVAVASAVLAAGLLCALGSNQALARGPKVAMAPGGNAVVEELWNHGARSAFVYVSAGEREYTFAAGAGPPRTGDARFRIGSVSETFLAVIVLQLAEEGKLRLDDRLTQYARGLRAGGSDHAGSAARSHLGLANYGAFFWWLTRADRRTDLQPLDMLKAAETQPRVHATWKLVRVLAHGLHRARPCR
jgi:D-alanyl-D-alanine carboxypeptidase